MSLVFERLDPSRHARGNFSNREESLESYLKKQAGQDAKRLLAACYVLCELGSPEIIGYYTLSSFSLTPTEIPGELAVKLPRYDRLPAAMLGRLAVDTQHERKGMGERLLIDAIHRAAYADLAAMALVTDALHPQVVGFYQKYGFAPLPDTPLRLYLLLGKIRGQLGPLPRTP